jgi:tetratricopeptide (TPR) repeat protein
MIMSYKVAEHQLDFDIELERYFKCLKDDGCLYISVPTWFDTMGNFGLSGFDLEYYYEPSHINVWTQKTFENILRKKGFAIIEKNTSIYDSTYLCKKTAQPVETIVYEKPEYIKECLRKIKQADELFKEGKYDEALHLWPDFPTCHAHRAENMRKQAFEKGWDFIKKEIIDYAITSCPNSLEAYMLAADFCMRADKFQEAIKYVEEGLKRKPHSVNCYMMLVNCMRELHVRGRTEDEKLHYLQQAKQVSQRIKQVSLEHFKQATDMIYFYNAQIPMEGENVS